MKIVSRFFMLLLCLVLASACAQDEPLVPENGGNTFTPELSTRTIHMTAGTASAGDVTRTTLDGVNVLWDEGDQFRVMDTNGLDWVMTADEDAPTHTSGGFTGTTNSTIQPTNSAMAVFPSEELTAYTDGKLIITIPQTQTYVAGSFDHKANVMVGPVTPVTGETDTYSAEFYNMMGVLKLQLTGDHDFITTIKITDLAGNNLWGTATLSAKDFITGISVDNIKDGSSSITLNCGFVELTETPTDFYFVVPVGAFSQGFDVEFTNSNDNPSQVKKSSPKEHSIKINSIKRMANMKVDGFEVEEVNIENQATKEYLNKGPYNNWGSDSYFQDKIWIIKWIYSVSDWGKKCIDQDYPLGKEITLTSGNKVTLTDITNGRDVYSERKIESSSHTFINLVPDHYYTYKVFDNDKFVKGGKFKAIGRMRWLIVDDTWNVRDIGGWTGLEGKQIKYEWIYRCGSLNGEWKDKTSKFTYTKLGDPSNYNYFTENSKQQLIDLGIKGELDLRALSSEETDKSKTDYSHAYSIGIDHTGVPGWIFERISTGNALRYPLTDPAFVKDIAWIIDQVVNKNNPVAFHCKSGADRTGGVAFTIFALLGVSEGDIALEFELTNMSHEQKIVKGKSEIRGKYTKDVSASNENAIYTKAFTSDENNIGTNWQEKAYYYLNQTFKSKGIYIKAQELDAFIIKMLGLKSYTHPSWAE